MFYSFQVMRMSPPSPPPVVKERKISQSASSKIDCIIKQLFLPMLSMPTPERTSFLLEDSDDQILRQVAQERPDALASEVEFVNYMVLLYRKFQRDCSDGAEDAAEEPAKPKKATEKSTDKSTEQSAEKSRKSGKAGRSGRSRKPENKLNAEKSSESKAGSVANADGLEPLVDPLHPGLGEPVL